MAPKEYMQKVLDELQQKEIATQDHSQSLSEFTSLKNRTDLAHNMKINSIGDSLFEADYTTYNDFLAERRKLMAQKIKAFYHNL